MRSVLDHCLEDNSPEKYENLKEKYKGRVKRSTLNLGDMQKLLAEKMLLNVSKQGLAK